MRSLWLLLAPQVAFAQAAFESALRVDGEAGYSRHTQDGLATQGIYGAAALGYSLNGFFVLRGEGALHRQQSAGRSATVGQLGLGVLYQLDVFEYVPWVGLTPGLYLHQGVSQDEGEWRFGLAYSAGLDWLISPSTVLGLTASYHALYGDEPTPGLLTAGFRLGYRFTLDDPFAP